MSGGGIDFDKMANGILDVIEKPIAALSKRISELERRLSELETQPSKGGRSAERKDAR